MYCMYLLATHATKAVRVFQRMGHLLLFSVEVFEFRLRFAAEALLTEPFARLPNVHQGGTGQVRTASVRASNGVTAKHGYFAVCLLCDGAK